jgi:threonyl-tRNA synthetase
MSDTVDTDRRVLLVMGCPEVPVQMGIGLYLAHMFRTTGKEVTVAGNPSVLQLLRVSDPDRHYVTAMMDLDRCIEQLVEKKKDYGIVVTFAHNDAGISYAATMRHISKGRLVVLVFGRNAESLAAQIDFPCEKVVEAAVHNPGKLRQKVNEVFGWRASTS